MCNWSDLLRQPATRLSLAASTTMLSGILYYVYWRAPNSQLTDYSAGAFPSLVHTLVLTWLTFALCGPRRGFTISSILLVISLAAEVFIGYFSLLDVWMLLAGFASGSGTAALYLRNRPVKRQSTAKAGALTVSLCTLFIAGSAPNFGCWSCPIDYANAKPVYMDYQTLRSAVKVSEPRELTDTSRVYVYQSFVFLNNKNNGIHVIDNADPTSPANVAFIEIPGNTELSIRSNYLYADSYIDMITLDIGDPENVIEVDRVQEIFPYDPYQNIPEDIYFDYNDIDENRGVITSYEPVN